MRDRQKIYAMALGILSIGMLICWTIQAVFLARGTYSNPITDGWILLAFLISSPFTTGLALAIESPKKATIGACRYLLFAQIPLVLLFICASSMANVLYALAAAVSVFAAVSGIVLSAHTWMEHRF